MLNVNPNHLWTDSEDDIITLLHNDTLLNLTIREISFGLFNRSKLSVASRIMRLRQQHRIR